MAAPKGNKFWESRSSHGRNPEFKNPEEMWTCASEYFQWVEDNPLLEEKGFAFHGVVTKEKFNKMRAMTAQGFCNFLGITTRTWRGYRDREDFIPVMEMIEQVMFAQKFEGASADLLNGSIIARELGLADKQEVVGGISLTINQDDAEL